MNLQKSILLGLSLAILLVGACYKENPTALKKQNPTTDFALEITVIPAGITLIWPSVEIADFLEYRIYRSEESALDFSLVHAQTDTIWTDTNVVIGNTYYYMVAIADSEGNETIQSEMTAAAAHSLAEFSINDGAEYSATQNVNVSITAADCLSALVWNGSLADSTTGQEYSFATGNLSIEDWELPAGEGSKRVWAKLRYDFNSQKYLTNLDKANVIYQNDITLDQTVPNVLPELRSPAYDAIAQRYRVYLHWTPGYDEICPDLSYVVYLWADGGSEQQVYSGTTTNCFVTGLVFETTYFWRVVVYDGAGNFSTGPAWSFTAKDEMVLIPAGSFEMGSPYGTPGRNSDETLHTVTFNNDLWVSPYEVTEQLWDDVMDTGNSISQRPKVNVTWNDAILFCNAISVQRGFEPVYTYNGSGRVTWNPLASGYRLLTEAEWEYTCRAGSETAFANGEITDISCADPALNSVGRYCGNNEGQSSAVGSLEPNAWGLYDMHGNVWEWCWDIYQGDHLSGAATDPVIGGYDQDYENTYRIIRGGNFFNSAGYCRSSGRTSSAPAHSAYGIGFRIAR